MLSISEIIIISADKSDSPWLLEGEIVFETDLTCPFSAEYYEEDGEFADLTIEDAPGAYDKRALKEMIADAAEEFDE